MMFKSAGRLVKYECSQERGAKGRASPVKDSCENGVIHLGQGVTFQSNRAWPSVSASWERTPWDEVSKRPSATVINSL